MKKIVVHVIPNAHLDPVWLWDFREGLNEGVATCRTVLDLLDANPDLTFIRGEAAIYEHIRRTDPATFARIKRMIRAGRSAWPRSTQPPSTLTISLSPTISTRCSPQMGGSRIEPTRHGADAALDARRPPGRRALTTMST